MATFDKTHPASPVHYSASETILLLLDYHSLFVQYAGPSAQPAAHKAAELRAWAKSQSIVVGHAIIDPTLPYAPYAKDPERSQGLIDGVKSSADAYNEPDGIRCDDGSEPVFLRAPGYVSVQKSGGFDEFLAEHEIKNLILAGLSTSGCVLRSAVVASENDFVVTVVEDACADPAEGIHEAMVKNVLPMRAHVCNLAELRREWEGANKS